jgi:hypothetical protein
MSTVPNAVIVAAAITALAPFYPRDRQQVADMLLFWIRRAELTAADIVEVQDQMFPPATRVEEPANDSACPPECRQNWQRASDPVEHVDHCPRRIEASSEFRGGYATGYVDAITAVKALGRDGLGAIVEIAEGHLLHVCCGKLDNNPHRNFCEHYGNRSPAEWFLDETAARWEQERRELLAKISGCPEWCALTHDVEDDARDDMALHMGDDHTDDTVRKLLDAHALEVRVARLDVLSEGRTGTPNLHVRVDAEVTTWQQAAELARTILDAFGYVPAGAE